MNTIRPATGNIQEKRMQKYKNHPLSQPPSPSFKSGAATIITQLDDPIFNIFAQNYGDIGARLGRKVGKLASQDAGNKLATNILQKSSRFSLEKGVSSIKEKTFVTSFLETLAFPFVTLPLYGASWVLDKVKSIPTPQNASKGVKNAISSITKKAENLYRKPLLRVPRKLNELNDKTDILMGIKGKTEQIIKKFADEKGRTFDDVVKLLNSADDSPLAKEAHEYVKENLYKVSNKFFDKHTGNFNTAFERPLNRLVTGLIPVGFLAADAYNLSVLCGDKKEDSEKEAKERASQEISRVFTTAFIQLLTLGSCTKLANTKAWFTPATSAATVLFSETSSRKRIGKPVFFLSPERAKEYNRKQAEKEGKAPTTTTEKQETAKNEVQASQPIKDNKRLNNLYTPVGNEPSVFTSFKAKETKDAKKKDEPKKALMNMDTFKKLAGILVVGGFVVSFLKNSTAMKNTPIMKQARKVGDFFKNQYNKIAFKDFEISKSDYEKLIKTLEDSGCKEIAEGHNLIMKKYGSEITANSTIKMIKHSLSSKGSKNAVNTTVEKLKEVATGLSDDEMKLVSDSLHTAIKQSKTSIEEHKFEDVARKAIEIIKNRTNRGKINIQGEEQFKSFSDSLIESFSTALRDNADKKYIQIETKAKPFVDIVIQPFKFIWSAANLPFEKIIKPVISLAASPVTKKAAEAELGKLELTKTQATINKVVKEIFGEQKAKSGKISQTIFANAMEQLQRQTEPYRKAQAELQKVKDFGGSEEAIKAAEAAVTKAKEKLQRYVTNAVEKSFNGVTQSSNKNTDIAMMTKLASSTVTSAFLVADNYNMVMIKSDGEDKEGAKEKAYERIIQRLSALFYQSMLINWFNSTFRATYNSSLRGMAAVAAPNTLTTEILTRKSIGMPITKKSYEELYENEKKNENRTGFVGEYFKFMRLLTGKKPLKDRMPKDKQVAETKQPEAKALYAKEAIQSTTARTQTTNLLEMLSK